MLKEILGESKILISLAVPIAISQASRVGMGVVDTIFAGNVSARDLAAVGLGSAIWLAIFFFVSGVLLVAAPLIGERKRKAGATLLNTTVEQVSVNSIFWGVVSVFALIASTAILRAIKMDAYITRLASEYLYVIAIGAIPTALFQGLKFTFDGLGQPTRGMQAGITGFLINIPLNYIFVFGALGVPAMGAVGCAWATTLSYWVMMIMLLLQAKRNPPYDGAAFSLMAKPRLEEQRYLFGKGLPSGIMILLDAGFFSAVAFLAVAFGALAVAANQIATNFVSLLFVGQMAVSMAIAIRVAQRKSDSGARHAISAGIALSCTLSLIYIALLIGFGRDIAALYSSDPEIRSLAVSLLSVAVLFQFVDAIQVCLSGALRGMHDTLIPMIVVGLSYWGIAFPIAYLQTYTELLGHAASVVSIWYGITVGILFAGVTLTARFLRKRSELHSASVALLSQ